MFRAVTIGHQRCPRLYGRKLITRRHAQLRTLISEFAVMTVVVLLSAFTVLARAVPSSASTLIDFDNGTDDSAVGSFYSGLGVTFSNTQWTDNFGVPGSSGPLGISAIIGALGEFQPDVSTPLVGVFSSPVSDVSIIALGVGEHGARIDAYDSAVGGSLVDFDEVFGIGLGTDIFFTLSTPGPMIRRIELYQPSQFLNIGDGLAWDDLVFIIPEPSTVILAAIGLVGFAAFGWRRRKR